MCCVACLLIANCSSLLPICMQHGFIVYCAAVQVHGWLMCLAWGALIPIGVVIVTFRTVRGAGTWWFHLHQVFNSLGFLVSLAGVAVGVYLDPGEGGLVWQHKIIGITVNVLALVQVNVHLLSVDTTLWYCLLATYGKLLRRVGVGTDPTLRCIKAFLLQNAYSMLATYF